MIFILCIPALIIGILIGIVSGLTPGIHVNVVASLMVAFYSSASLDEKWSLPICIFIVAVSITHTFFDYLPSLFLGVPTDEVYALLPGQRLIKEGRGGEALKLSIEGSWRGLLIALTVAIFCTLLTLGGINPLASMEDIIKPILVWILLFISCILIITESNHFWAITLFLLSGLFGIIIFGTPLIAGGSSSAFTVLFPALSGLFGLSGLLQALSEETTKLPSQLKDMTLNVSEDNINKATFMGVFAGIVVGLLPGLGAANAATLTLLLSKGKKSDTSRLYIVTTSAIQSADTVFGIAALYFIEKSRSGASVAIGSIIGEINASQTLLILTGMFVSGFLSYSLLLKTWRIFFSIINHLNHRALTLAVIMFISTLVLMTTGFWGFVILIASTSLGLLPAIVKVKRTQLMGLFLIPVMLFFSGFQDSFVSLFGLQAQISPSASITLSQVCIFLVISFTVGIAGYFLQSTANPSL
jgi:putative membrane protein